MRSEKIQISSESADGQTPEPLWQLIEYCLSHGMQLIGDIETPFSFVKKQKRCSLRGPLTLDDIQKVFSFPRHVIIKPVSGGAEIWDCKNNTEITIINPDQEAQARANLERWCGPSPDSPWAKP